MLDVLVPEVSLQCPRVVASVGQCVAAGMSKHVWMGFEAELGPLACSLHYAGKSCRFERYPTF